MMTYSEPVYSARFISIVYQCLH